MKRRVFGANLVFALGLTFALPGAAQAQDAAGRTGGILTGKSTLWIEVKVDGERQPRRFLPRFLPARRPLPSGPDRAMLARFQMLVVGNRVEMLWAADQILRVIQIVQIAPRGRAGKLIGTVQEAGRNWIDVLPDNQNEPLERYFPRWLEDDNGGAFDANAVKQLAALRAGDRVTMEWIYDERKRAVSATKMKAEKPKAESAQG